MTLTTRAAADATRKAAQATRADAVAAKHCQIKTPHSVSLVAVPANQRAFSVIRSADAENATTEVPAVRRRVRRSDVVAGLMSIVFPPGYTEEDVASTMKAFGLGTEYTTVVKDGHYEIQRGDLQSTATSQTATIKLTEDGIMATVVREAAAPAGTPGQTGIKLVAIEIDVERHDMDATKKFLSTNGVDFSLDALENLPETGTAVLERSEMPADADTRRIELEPGFVAVIARADRNDLPIGFAQAVCEEAYGTWGWGQLDFAAAMADRAVCEALEDGISRFRSVVDRILFYSDLPVDARKMLVTRALTQFGDYVNGLLDSLPRQVLIAVGQTQRSDKPAISNPSTTQESSMTQQTAATTAQTSPAAAATPDAGQPVTRKDFEALGEELRNLIRAGQTAAPGAASTTAATTAPATAPAASAEEAQRSDSTLAATVAAAVAAAIQPMAENVQRMAQTTILRSDASDPAQAKTGDTTPEPKTAEDKANHVMRGALGLGRK